MKAVLAIASLLLAISACGPSSQSDEATADDDRRWAVVGDYLDRQAAWEQQAGDMQEILMTGDGTIEDKIRRAEEEHGQLPDASAAVAAARELVAAGGPHTVEAAEFLLERSGSLVAMMERVQAIEELAADVGPDEAVAGLGSVDDATWEALIATIDPDWTVVQDYLDERDVWYARMRTGATEGGGPRGGSTQDRPSAIRAVATARAILDADGVHEKVVEAAEFLVDHAWGVPRGDQHAAAGARALMTHALDHDDLWPRVLRALDRVRGPSGTGAPDSPIEQFFSEMASDTDNPVLRATAQYHLAAGLMREAKGSMMTSVDHAARRERALEHATGLSAGVEDETFDDSTRRVADDEAPRTFAQAEADLIDSIRHATIGGTLPEWTGRRLDGAEESLSAYRGRVLLIDFWATWCVPCIHALPDLREMVADLPADRFALLAISVDEELDTVTEFMKQEAMPWDNWHVGLSSGIERILDVRGFPTYLLADENGTIQFNGNAPLAKLRCMAERMVAGEAPDCSPAEWLGANLRTGSPPAGAPGLPTPSTSRGSSGRVDSR